MNHAAKDTLIHRFGSVRKCERCENLVVDDRNVCFSCAEDVENVR